MYKIEDVTRTYGQVADILNDCDSQDIPIFVSIQTGEGTVINVPIDNFQLFKEITGHDPDEVYPLRLVEEDDIIYLMAPVN